MRSNGAGSIRPRCGLDLDNVIYDWEGHARWLLRTWWDIDLPVSTDYDMIRQRIGRERWDWLFDDGVSKFGLFSGGPILKDAAIILPEIALTHDVVVLTRRPRSAIRDTYDWLHRHMIHPSELVILHDVPGKGDAITRAKADVECDWYVDDSPAEVEDLDRRGKDVYLMDRPWNQQCTAGIRVANWYELRRMINV